MKITKGQYKDVPAVCVETEKLFVKFLPQYGCRLQSVIDKATGREFMALDDQMDFLPQSLGGNYIEGDVSGCDDMFPTIDPMTLNEGSRAGVEYPCHGEVCRVPHEVESLEDRIITRYTSRTLHYHYQKIIEESENGGIAIRYCITNLAKDDFHCMWAAHFMIAAEEGGYAVTPYEDGTQGEIMFDEQSQFGRRGEVFGVGKTALTSGRFSKDANAYKFFFLEKLPLGECGYFVPSVSKTLKLKFEKDKLPYLGVWVNNGAFKEMYNVAMEVATAPFDKPETAMQRGIDFKIAPGETFTFQFAVEIE